MSQTSSTTLSKHAEDLARKRAFVVHPSGILSRPPGFVEKRRAELAALGFSLTELHTECPSENGFAAGTAVERAVLFAHALTNRRAPLLWAARGGSGVSEILPHLERMLPPVLPPKTFVGFSDNSLLGCWLAIRFPNLRYVHANHAYEPSLFSGGPALDVRVLFEILEGRVPEPLVFRMEPPAIPGSAVAPSGAIEGPLVPLNVSLAHVLATVPGAGLPEGNVLFLEDLNEELYRVLRAFDSTLLAGFLSSTRAIVLGTFTDCPTADGSNATLPEIAELVARKTRLPVYSLPMFGHERWRLPLVFGAPVRIEPQGEGAQGAFLHLSFDAGRPDIAASNAPAGRQLPRASSAHDGSSQPRLHFTGIGGTGMAAVAGLFRAAGFPITGSDGPIYPPMDKTIRDIGVEPLVGYEASNILAAKPDAVVLANVVSRRNAELKPNGEFEALLQDTIPLYSFPAALRHFFLHGARNVVVAGTHGKTTTTSLLAHLLTELGEDPSFMVGGSPKNFGIGFALRNRELFVLEGDEYDSALFDKGPKFLHYEPTVALMNNIEFDHADIYAYVEAIEREFENLGALCERRGGIVVANAGCPQVRRVSLATGTRILFFGTEADLTHVEGRAAWTLLSHRATRTGVEITVRTPWGETLTAPVGLFGTHNALNATAALACIHALHLDASARIDNCDATAFDTRASRRDESLDVSRALVACGSFEGVKRRFEFVGSKRDITVFDDFAHHPTAIHTTLEAFRSYLDAAGVTGRLVACFDPRNATMRRRVLQDQLAHSFDNADIVLLGKIAVDKRLADDEILDSNAVARAVGEKCQSFSDNDALRQHLVENLRPGDTVVFMSSGAFDGLPRKLLDSL